MTVGLKDTTLANKWLDMLGGTAFTAPATTAVQLHTGDPGAAGTANGSSETTRKVLTWSAASGGSKSIAATLPSWASWSQGTQTITHITIWDSATAGAGNFLLSIALTTGKQVTNGDTLNLTGATVSLAPLAA